MKRLLGVLLVAWASFVHAAPVTDDRGVTVDLKSPPRRVVTLLPSLTETVCELGACDRLVGVDDYSNWPAAVQRLPHVGGLDDAQVERIVALEPDVVLVGSTARVAGRLERLGLPVLGLDIKTLADAHRVMDTVGRLLQVPGAEQAWQRVEQGIEAAARSVPASARGTRVYFEVSDGPYAASERSHIGELLTRLGAGNVVPGRLGSVPKLNPEFVVRADPDLVVIAAREAPALPGRPGWSRIRALREGRVCALSREQGDVVARPGPRLAEAAQVLADCLSRRARGWP